MGKGKRGTYHYGITAFGMFISVLLSVLFWIVDVGFFDWGYVVD